MWKLFLVLSLLAVAATLTATAEEQDFDDDLRLNSVNNFFHLKSIITQIHVSINYELVYCSSSFPPIDIAKYGENS